MTCPNKKIVLYTANQLSSRSANCIYEHTALCLAVYNDSPLNSQTANQGNSRKRGAGFTGGAGAMEALSRGIHSDENHKSMAALSHARLLWFCKKQVCVFVTQKLPLCRSAGADLLPAPDGRMEAQDAVPASCGLPINSSDNSK